MSIKKTLAGFVIATLASAASAAWPDDKPIRIVVPYPAGGFGDVVMRDMADRLRPTLGTMIVENRTGAAGNIGMEVVARAAPDGHTFVFGGGNNFVTNQYIYRSMRFDPTRMRAVTVLCEVPSVVFVNTDSNVRQMADLVEFSQKRPGRVFYGSPGIGSLQHLSGEAISQTMSLGMTHVPFKGAPEAILALLANDVQMVVVGASLGINHVRTGKLRAIAVSGNERAPMLPDTPTLAEANLGAIKSGSWWPFAAPEGTPNDIIARMYTLIRDNMGSPSGREFLASQGSVPILSTPEATTRRITEESDYWKARLSQWKITLD